MPPRVLTGGWKPALISLGLGLAAFLLHMVALGHPGPWTDEAVTVMSARRSLDTLAETLQLHDLVHGAYYFVGHLWGAVFGTDVVSMRAMSALSVGFSTCLMVVLGNMMLGLRFGVYSALVFTTLPRVIWTATEARSPALVTTVVIATMILFLAALRHDSPGTWIGYGLLLVCTVLLFEFAALDFLVLPLVAIAARPSRRAVIRFCAVTVLAVLICVPFLVHTTRQRDAVSWIADEFTLGSALKAVASDQFLTPEGVSHWAPIDVLVWTMALVGICLAAWRGRQEPDARVSAVLTAGWLFLPTGFLLGYSLLTTPAYTERYLASSAPAMALAVSLVLFYVPLPRKSPSLAAVVPVALVMLLSVSAWMHYHRTYAKSGWATMAQAVQAKKEPGDVIVAAGPMEAASVLVLPDEFSALEVINIDVPYYADNTPWGRVTPIHDDANLLDGHQRVWFLSTDGIDDEDAATFKSRGFTERWKGQEYQLGAILYERDPR